MDEKKTNQSTCKCNCNKERSPFLEELFQNS